jgi:hypothetical protein
LKEYRNTDYRSIVGLVELMDRLRSKIGLKEIPHYTTLQKFNMRVRVKEAIELYLEVKTINDK